MIKAAFFDIDGTLYCNEQHRVLPSTMYALRQLKEKGVHLFICSNRSIDEIDALPVELTELMNGYVSLAGSQLSAGGENLFVPKLKQDEAEAVIELLEQNKITYRWVAAGQKGHLNCDDAAIEQLFQDAYGMSPCPKKYSGEVLSHLLYYTKDEQLLKQLEKTAPSMEHLHLGYPNEMLVKGATKGSGMKKMTEHFGFSLTECAAFGDGLNDADMLEAAGFGIAMGNAKENCKLCADYVTDHIENDGLYKACLHYGWIERDSYEN